MRRVWQQRYFAQACHVDSSVGARLGRVAAASLRRRAQRNPQFSPMPDRHRHSHTIISHSGSQTWEYPAATAYKATQTTRASTPALSPDGRDYRAMIDCATEMRSSALQSGDQVRRRFLKVTFHGRAVYVIIYDFKTDSKVLTTCQLSQQQRYFERRIYDISRQSFARRARGNAELTRCCKKSMHRAVSSTRADQRIKKKDCKLMRKRSAQNCHALICRNDATHLMGDKNSA